LDTPAYVRDISCHYKEEEVLKCYVDVHISLSLSLSLCRRLWTFPVENMAIYIHIFPVTTAWRVLGLRMEKTR
jgi:hypothetical protein